MTKAKKKAKEEPKITLAPGRLPEILDRLITEPYLREQLEQNPVEVLEELGIELDKPMRKKLSGRKLSEAIGEDALTRKEFEAVVGILPAAFVVVATRGTKPVTNSKSKSSVISGAKSVTSSTTTAASAVAVATIFDVTALESEATSEPKKKASESAKRKTKKRTTRKSQGKKYRK